MSMAETAKSPKVVRRSNSLLPDADSAAEAALKVFIWPRDFIVVSSAANLLLLHKFVRILDGLGPRADMKRVDSIIRSQNLNQVKEHLAAMPRRRIRSIRRDVNMYKRVKSIPSTLLLAVVVLGVLLPPGCAADEPKPDPAGIATGDKTTAVDASGNPFVVPEPTDKNAPDYAKTKKDFDDFQAQAAKEPLAVKLADSVGHIRIATNFAWTLNTGYLVLFMQAGFALLTCGLVRKKNAGHLMMLNFAAYVIAFIAYYVCGFAFMYGGAAINAAPSGLGGTPTLTHAIGRARTSGSAMPAICSPARLTMRACSP